MKIPKKWVHYETFIAGYLWSGRKCLRSFVKTNIKCTQGDMNLLLSALGYRHYHKTLSGSWKGVERVRLWYFRKLMNYSFPGWSWTELKRHTLGSAGTCKHAETRLMLLHSSSPQLPPSSHWCSSPMKTAPNSRLVREASFCRFHRWLRIGSGLSCFHLIVRFKPYVCFCFFSNPYLLDIDRFAFLFLACITIRE